MLDDDGDEAASELPGVARVCPLDSEAGTWIRGDWEAQDFSDETCKQVLKGVSVVYRVLGGLC